MTWLRWGQCWSILCHHLTIFHQISPPFFCWYFFPERPKGKRIGCDSDAFYVKRRLIELVAFQKVGSCCCFCCWVVYRHHCPPIAPAPAAQMKSQSKTRWRVGQVAAVSGDEPPKMSMILGIGLFPFPVVVANEGS